METNSDLKIVLGIGAMLLLCLVVIVAGSFFVASQVTEPLNTAATALARSNPPIEKQAGATQTADYAAAAESELWPVVLADDFDSGLNPHRWPTGQYSDLFLTGTREISGGSYNLEATIHAECYWWGGPNMRPVSDFAASLDAQSVAGSELTSYGLLFRQNDLMGYYRFLIQDNQFFVVDKSFGIHQDTLIRPTWSAAIRPREVNHLMVVGRGSHFTFLINGQTVAEYTDSSIDSGRVGIVYDFHRPGDKLVLKFDNFELRVPNPPAQATAVVNTPDANERTTMQPGQAMATAAAAWPLALTDFFEAVPGNQYSWPTGPVQAGSMQGTREMAAGVYRWQFQASGDGLIWSQPALYSVSDFDLTALVQQDKGPNNAQAGLVFRYWDDFNFYRFVVENDRYFSVILRTGGRDQPLILRRAASAIQPGGANQLTVIGQGTNFKFLINGELVGQADDKTFSQGRIGLALGLPAGTAGSCTFSRIQLRAPNSTPTPAATRAPTGTPTATVTHTP